MRSKERRREGEFGSAACYRRDARRREGEKEKGEKEEGEKEKDEDD